MDFRLFREKVFHRHSITVAGLKGCACYMGREEKGWQKLAVSKIVKFFCNDRWWNFGGEPGRGVDVGVGAWNKEATQTYRSYGWNV